MKTVPNQRLGALAWALLLLVSSSLISSAQNSLESKQEKKSNSHRRIVIASQASERARSGKQFTTIHKLDEEGIKQLIGRRGGRSRPLLLFLWYTACQLCRERLEDVIRINNEYRERGLDLALVSISPIVNQASLSRFLTENKIGAPAYLLEALEDELAEEIFLRDWEVTVPSVFFYDHRGHLMASETEVKRINYQILKDDAVKLLSLTRAQAYLDQLAQKARAEIS